MVFDRNTEQTHRLAAEGAVGADSLDDLISRLTRRGLCGDGAGRRGDRNDPRCSGAKNYRRMTSSSMAGTRISKMMFDVPQRLGHRGSTMWMSEQAEEPGDWSEGIV